MPNVDYILGVQIVKVFWLRSIVGIACLLSRGYEGRGVALFVGWGRFDGLHKTWAEGELRFGAC